MRRRRAGTQCDGHQQGAQSRLCHVSARRFGGFAVMSYVRDGPQKSTSFAACPEEAIPAKWTPEEKGITICSLFECRLWPIECQMIFLIQMLIGTGFGWWAATLFKARGDAASDGPANDDSVQSIRAWKFCIFFVSAAVVIAVSFASFLDRLWSPVYIVESFLLSPSMLALTSGFAIGLWANICRRGIAKRLDDFYDAFLGSGESSSWALQSLVVVGGLLIVLLLFRPELVRRLDSFKAGEVEAKFANISETTREATRVNFDLGKVVGIKNWVYFPEYYLSGSARDDALKFDGSKIQEERKKIRDLLFNDYIMPSAILLNCMQRDDQTSVLRQDDELVLLIHKIRIRVLSEDGTGRSFGERDWRSMLGSIDRRVGAMLTVVEANITDVARSRCPKLDKIDRRADWSQAIKETVDAVILDRLVREAVDTHSRPTAEIETPGASRLVRIYHPDAREAPASSRGC
jgi:hypothetical protein